MKTTNGMTKVLLGGGAVLLFVCMLVGDAVAQVCVPPPAGLVSWWPGDGNATDIVDGNHGTPRAGATFAAGLVGQAFRLDGIDDYVHVPDAANLDLTSFTVMAWVNRQGGWSWGYAGIVTKGTVTQPGWGTWVGPINYALLIRDQTTLAPDRFEPAIVYRGTSGAVEGFETSGFVLPLGTWHHFAGTYDVTTGTWSLYHNGLLLGTGPGSVPVTNTEPVRIGYGMEAWPGSGIPRFFPGLVDEAQVYDRALSAEEIGGIYRAGRAGVCREEVHPITVSIDIKPGSSPNSINPESKGVIPVAILTTDTFDATTVDVATVRFGRNGTEAAPVQAALEDVDGDGDTDMIFHFDTRETGIQCRDTSATLTGETSDGKTIIGSDAVRTVGCK